MMFFNMTYCPPNVRFDQIWYNHGLSKCFMDTVSTIVITLYMFIFGTAQLLMYRRYGTEVNLSTLPKSNLYNLQRFLHIFIVLQCILRIVLQGTILDNNQIYGYMVIL